MAYLFDKGRFVTKARNKPKEIYALHETIDFMNQKRIQIDTGSSSDFIQLARQDRKLHEKYKEIWLMIIFCIFIKIRFLSSISVLMFKNCFTEKI